YIIKYIFFPVIINITLVTVCYRINAMRIKAQIKNYSVLITVSLMAAVIAFIHYTVGAILTIFVIPVFLTILFGQKKMTAIITIINGVLLVFSTIHSATYNDSIYFYLNVAVALTLIISAYLISTVLIEYNKANSDYIYSSYQTQLSLNEQARNDSLTGLYNQKTFQSLLTLSIEKARSHKSSMSLAIIDLDDFKEINDTFGHLEGDQVLLHFTNLIKQQCKEGDAYVSRYGGDEFAVIFPKASKELAYLRLESLRQRCKQVPQSKVRSGEISFSAGISHYMGGEMNESLLFHQADSALYQAKENGKGQTVVYPY
ncbi:MAG TPA: GGDEF domain-containing protein, partial [Anaerovoracaceae bacterium]|nr:GGDEF domain-containing protein [Anaerovoracaceae bacterium]